MDNDELTADILNLLLQIHTDRINAYQKALHKSRLELDLKAIFERIIEESMRFKRDLNNKLIESKKTKPDNFSTVRSSQPICINRCS